jgi:type III secretion protein Q
MSNEASVTSDPAAAGQNGQGQSGRAPSLDVQLALVFGPTLPCSIRVPIGSDTVALTLAHTTRLPTIPLLTICIAGTTNDERFQVYVGWAHIDACLEDLAPGLAAATLTAETKALLFEASLATQLDALERALDAKILIQSIEMLKKRDRDWAQPNLKFLITWGSQQPRPAYAAIPPEFERRLVRMWSGRIDGDTGADPELAVTVRVGCVSLSPDDVAALAVDDVLVLDATPLYNQQCCLVIGERLAALGDIDGNQLLLTEPLTMADSSWNAKYCLDDTTTRAERRNGPHAPPQATLAVDLARQKIRVSQLLGIDLSRAIGLPKSIQTGVEVYAGDRAIGFGNIVRVGDAIAVRLIRINAHG